MGYFKKKPVTIEAHQFDGSSTGVGEMKRWMDGNEFARCQVRTMDLGRTLEISTLEGVMTASVGDWIIKGVSGEFYPCKPDIFEKSYDPV